jgi:hypothetical protein
MCDGCETTGGTTFSHNPLPLPKWTIVYLKGERYDLCPKCSPLIKVSVENKVLLKSIADDVKNKRDEKYVNRLLKKRKESK